MRNTNSAKLAQCFDLSMANMEYLVANYDELAKEYNNKWIAILDRQVIASSDSIEELGQIIKKHARSECVVVEYMTTEPIAMFF